MKNTKQEERNIITIEAKDLVARYEKVEALRIEALKLSGRVVAVVGHNGSGKSTLIKTALGLLGNAGSLSISRTNSWGDKTILIPEKHMAYSPERGSVFSDITVENYIKLWCRIKQNNAKYYLGEGRKYLEQLGVEPLLSKLGRNLSKGERRRVQTAVGFISNPLLFFFDEPFDGLDVRQASYLAEIMMEASTSMGLIISSHQMNVVERLADKIIVLKDGAIHACGGVEEVSRELAEKTWCLKVGSEEVAFELCMGSKEIFSNSLIHQQNRRIYFTGSDLNKAELTSWCYEIGVGEFELEENSPNLTDAMGYHLMKLQN